MSLVRRSEVYWQLMKSSIQEVDMWHMRLFYFLQMTVQLYSVQLYSAQCYTVYSFVQCVHSALLVIRSCQELTILPMFLERLCLKLKLKQHNCTVLYSVYCNHHTFGILTYARIISGAYSRPGGNSNEQEIQFYPILMSITFF